MKTVVLCLLVAGALAAPSRKPTFRRGLNRIIGGQEATPEQFPYQLSVQDTSFGSGFHICGASIYSKNSAIGASHCFQGEGLDNVQVVAGELDFDTEEGNEQVVAVSKLIQHEDFNHFTLRNDVAILQLSQPLTFNAYVQAIPLRGDKEFMGDCTVAGWGDTTVDGDRPSVLNYIDVQTISDSDCRSKYDGEAFDDSMICAGVTEGGKAFCMGDFGSPLACDGQLTGIASWGYGCYHPDYAGVYAEVAYFKDWIEANAV